MPMSKSGPRRGQSDLADMVEMLLDKGVVVNADIAVSVGDTELLGVKIRAAVASFETAAQYGLEFPEGTDMERVDAAAAGRSRRVATDAGGDGVEGESPDRRPPVPGADADHASAAEADADDSGDIAPKHPNSRPGSGDDEVDG